MGIFEKRHGQLGIPKRIIDDLVAFQFAKRVEFGFKIREHRKAEGTEAPDPCVGAHKPATPVAGQDEGVRMCGFPLRPSGDG